MVGNESVGESEFEWEDMVPCSTFVAQAEEEMKVREDLWTETVNQFVTEKTQSSKPEKAVPEGLCGPTKHQYRLIQYLLPTQAHYRLKRYISWNTPKEVLSALSPMLSLSKEIVVSLN